MKKQRLRRSFGFVMAAVLILFSTQRLFAGGAGGSDFRSKVQKRLESPSNIQYEPYYLPQTVSVAVQNEISNQSVQQFQEKEKDRVLRTSELKEDADRGTGSSGTNFSYVIYNVHYKAELEENVVTVNGKVVFEVFAKHGWVQIPLVNSSVGLIDVKVNKGASFVMNQGGKYYLVMDKPGRYSLDIEFLVKASREREHGPGNFNIDVLPAPISQFEFTIPEKDLQIFIDPAIKVETKDEGDKTSAWAVMPNTNSINVRWSKALPKEEIVSAKLEPKVYVETSTHSSVGGGIIRSRSFLNYSILQSEISSLRLALPEDVSILDVGGRDLRDWKVSLKEGIQYLDVFLNFGIKGNYELSLTYERDIEEGSSVIPMPWVKALGVERENGFYGISASTNVELAVKETDRVTTIDTKQLPSAIWNISTNPILLAFKYLNHPFAITIDVIRHEELPVLIAAIDNVECTSLFTKEGKILTKAVYQIRNNVKQFLRLKLPQGAVIWSSFVGSKPVKPAQDKEGHVLIPLETSRFQGQDLTTFPVEVVYLDKTTEMKSLGNLRLTLPQVDLPVSQFNWRVYLPLDYTYFGFEGNVRKVDGQVGFLRAVGQNLFGGRALQGRLKQAADDIGEQYSVAVLSSMAKGEIPAEQAGVGGKGLLPIRINIPYEGKSFRFSKLLSIEGEDIWLQVKYTAFLEKISGWLKLVILVVGIGVLGVWLRKKRS